MHTLRGQGRQVNQEPSWKIAHLLPQQCRWEAESGGLVRETLPEGSIGSFNTPTQPYLWPLKDRTAQVFVDNKISIKIAQFHMAGLQIGREEVTYIACVLYTSERFSNGHQPTV